MDETTSQNLDSVNQSPISDSAELGKSEILPLGSETSELGKTYILKDANGSLYNFEQLKEVYYLGMLNGATIWQLCQDNTKNPLSSFEKVTNELRNVVTSEQSIKDLASSQGMLLGVSAEILGLESIV